MPTPAPPPVADARTVAELTALAPHGARVEYLPFWGQRPQRDRSVGPGCLSQWWPSPFTSTPSPAPPPSTG